MADLISKIKGLDNVTYDLQDKVSIFGGTNLLAKCDWKNFDWTDSFSKFQSGNIEILSNNKLKIYANVDLRQQHHINSLDFNTPEEFQTICSFYIYENTLNNQFKGSIWGEFPESTWSGNGFSVDIGFTGFYSKITLWQGLRSGFTIDFNTTDSTSGYIIIGPVKLEKGNKSTDCTPAFRDLVTYKNETINFFQ